MQRQQGLQQVHVRVLLAVAEPPIDRNRHDEERDEVQAVKRHRAIRESFWKNKDV